MKNLMNKIFLLSIVFALFSCSEDYFDADENRHLTLDRINELKDESPETVVKLVEASLNGVYNNGVAFQNRHDDFGLKAFTLAGDLTGLDMVQTKHHWFGFDYNFDNRQANYRRPRVMWDVFYKQISSANIILNDFLLGDITDETLLSKKAETLAIRGISYYYLVNLFQHNYIGNENAAGVPIVTSPKDKNLPRAKVSEVYKQIVSDLRYAVENGKVTPSVVDTDKAVAAAYLAKTYATMQKWDSVAYYAQIASDAKPLTAKNIVEAGKWHISNPSWLWGYDITTESSTIYASFYSHIDNTTQGYTGALEVWKSIYSNLYNKISDTDIRKKLYINKEMFPDIANEYSALPDYANIKYRTEADFTGDYCFLRAEDPYLLLMEAKVELNQLGEAKSLLENLMKLRDDSYNASQFNSQNELREEVRLQRRIELWGEGTSFYDLKRWQLGVDRTVEGSNHRTKLTKPVTAKEWVYQIPQREMDSNPNIGEQNP